MVGLWAGKIRTAFTGDPQGLGALQAEDLRYLLYTLNMLRDKEIVSMTAQWIDATTTWQSGGPGEFFWLAMVLTDSGAACKSARLKLAEHIGNKYLADEAGTRLVSCPYWARFIWCFGKDLSAEVRSQWAGKIRAAFTGNLAELNDRQFKYLSDAVVRLDAGQAAPLVVAWLSRDESLEQASAGQLAKIACAGGHADRAAMAPLMNNLEAFWLAKNSQEPLKLGGSAFIVWAWLAVGDEAKARQWTTRVYETELGTDQAVASIDARRLMVLGRLLGDAGLTGKDKEHPAFAAALARLAREGKLPVDKWWRYGYYARPLCTTQTRQTVQAEVTDAEGNPRPIVTTILALAYRRIEELDTWQTFLDGKIATPGMAGDTKARWLIARAFAESVVPRERSPVRGKKWLDQALVAASSANCRVNVLEELVAIYRGMRRPAIANSILESMKNGFSGEELARIETLQQELQSEQASLEASAKADKVARELAHKASLLTYYRKQLALSKALKDTKNEAKLRVAIEKLEQELQQ